jgi:hypothetical protein
LPVPQSPQDQQNAIVNSEPISGIGTVSHAFIQSSHIFIGRTSPHLHPTYDLADVEEPPCNRLQICLATTMNSFVPKRQFSTTLARKGDRESDIEQPTREHNFRNESDESIKSIWKPNVGFLQKRPRETSNEREERRAKNCPAWHLARVILHDPELMSLIRNWSPESKHRVLEKLTPAEWRRVKGFYGPHCKKKHLCRLTTVEVSAPKLSLLLLSTNP